jgi:hypothetical protein
MIYQDDHDVTRYLDDAKTKSLRVKHGAKSLTGGCDDGCGCAHCAPPCQLCNRAIALTRTALEQLAQEEKDFQFARSHAVVANMHAKSFGGDPTSIEADAAVAGAEFDAKYATADAAIDMLNRTKCERCGQIPAYRREADALFDELPEDEDAE